MRRRSGADSGRCGRGLGSSHVGFVRSLPSRPSAPARGGACAPLLGSANICYSVDLKFLIVARGRDRAPERTHTQITESEPRAPTRGKSRRARIPTTGRGAISVANQIPYIPPPASAHASSALPPCTPFAVHGVLDPAYHADPACSSALTTAHYTLSPRRPSKRPRSPEGARRAAGRDKQFQTRPSLSWSPFPSSSSVMRMDHTPQVTKG